MNKEEQNEKLLEVWDMYENILEKVDDLGQSFYGFGEKLKETFGEKSKERKSSCTCYGGAFWN